MSQNKFESKVEVKPFGKTEALLKQDEDPVMNNKLKKLFPEAAKIFDETPNETTVKNETPIPNIK